MMSLNRTVFQLAIAAILVAIVAACSPSGKDEPLFRNSRRQPAESEPPVKDVPPDALASQRAFIAVSKKVTPSVVNISTISRKKIVRPLPDMPPFFDQFFGGPQIRRDRSLGSGFIISRDGFIVTNEHVVRDAESILVKLSNEKVYQATVVGTDPKTDIAVIKINSSDLPVSVLGDSDRIEVGQWAIAIGNPFGLERSMTVGVISATGRSNVGIETIENFIQTDASINPGNSGGPLLNIHGEVIGINTAIVATGQGIGFAIPTNMARPIISQLVEKGQVMRAWLGIAMQPMTEDQARALGLRKAYGAIIVELAPGGPAEKASLIPKDIIVEFGGTEVKNPAHLQQLVAAAKIGAPVRIVILRGGQQKVLTILPGNTDSESRSRRGNANEGDR